MKELFDILGAAGGPTTVAGICITVLVFLRKQEAGVRADINGSLARLTAENEAKDAEIARINNQIDELRSKKRELEDDKAAMRRRAEKAESKLRELENNES